MLYVSQERVVKVVGVIIQNGSRQRYFFGVKHTALLFKTKSDHNDLLKYVKRLK